MTTAATLRRPWHSALSILLYLAGEMRKPFYLRKSKRWPSQHTALVLEQLEQTLVSLTRKGIDPGGGYIGVWARDASEILLALAAVGRIDEALRHSQWIWSRRIRPGARVIRGRGSPALGFRRHQADEEFLRKTQGSMPSSIHNGYVEVYGEYPDIDSTALMVTATSKLLLGTNSRSMFDQLTPILAQALAYLETRDTDGDSLVEQGPNEDWMDNLRRNGELPYDQAIRIQALFQYAKLIAQVQGGAEAEHHAEEADRTEKKVKAWLKSEWEHLLQPLFQDTVHIVRTGLLSHPDSIRLLNEMKERLWKGIGPAVLAPTMDSTGPAKVRPNSYQNGGFWPWITNEEIKARLDLGMEEEGHALLAPVLSFSLIEWVDPFNPQKTGRYPFKTGLASTIRLLKYLEREQTNFIG